jgi:hypothetical protein
VARGGERLVAMWFKGGRLKVSVITERKRGQHRLMEGNIREGRVVLVPVLRRWLEPGGGHSDGAIPNDCGGYLGSKEEDDAPCGPVLGHKAEWADNLLAKLKREKEWVAGLFGPKEG